MAALLSGAGNVTAINSADCRTWPDNIEYASAAWGVAPEIVTADFRLHRFERIYDVILLLGVIYHVEDVFACIKTMRDLLVPGGILYIESQMSSVQSNLPIFEYASDFYPTAAPQDRARLGDVGISNYLFPNEHAVCNLAQSYDLVFESLSGGEYSAENPTRRLFKLLKAR